MRTQLAQLQAKTPRTWELVPGDACTVVYGKSKSAALCGGRIDEWAGGFWVGRYGMLLTQLPAVPGEVQGLDRDKDMMFKADVSREALRLMMSMDCGIVFMQRGKVWGRSE
jgi:hypothetical protein